MLTLSQNKKIAITAIALFLVSFVAMLFFLENNGNDSDHGQVNILDVGGHGEEVVVIDPETMYREYMGGTENPLFVINADGQIIFATDDSCDLLAVDCDDYVGKSFFEYINTKDLPEFVTSHMKLVQDPKLTEGMGPYRMIGEDKEILVLFNAYPVVDAEGKVEEIVFSIKDITEQAEEMNKDAEKIENVEGAWIETFYPRVVSMKK